MKRLLNAYGFRRGFDVVGVTDRDALARWTILEMRWPLLAEHLRTGGADEPSEEVSTLLGDPEVRDLAGKLRWDQLPQVAPPR